MSTPLLARKIAGKIHGRVVLPEDGEYGSIVQIDNGRVRLTPPIAVMAADVDDVMAIVKIAHEEKLRLTTRCGGHSATGYCLNDDGIVLDIRYLNSLRLDRDNRSLTVGMGARWKQVYDFVETSQTGFLPVGGGCAGVGVSGFLLGGGYSFASRSYGMGIDSLKSLRLVTADGNVLDLNSSSKGAEADLFWACRGGGGGNFGVALECELQLQEPQPNAFLVGQIQFPFFRIEDVLPFYNSWVETLPDEMAVYGFLGMQPNPKANNRPILSLRFTPVFNGDVGRGMDLLQPLMKHRPMAASFYEMTMPEWEEFIGTGTVVNGRSAYIRSLVMAPRALDARAAQIFMKYMSRCPSPDSFMVWTHGGGRIASVGDDATAFAFRGARFIPEIKSIWDSGRPQDMRQNVEWAYDFFEELESLGSSAVVGAYLNYIDPLLPGWKEKYHGKHYGRLLSIKKACDQDNVFRFQQGIGSPFEPERSRPLDLSPLQHS